MAKQPSWMQDGPVVKLKRKTPAQKKAYDRYKLAEQMEDNYLGSVFVNAAGQRRVEATTKAAYEECKRLGMGVEHGM
jgi:hypothetical protein